tara:strand:- start:392 stop:2341 length:1950 start_codon:yes stop_codon:yes gene_type:complete
MIKVIIEKLANLSRIKKTAIMIFNDFIIIFISFLIALYLFDRLHLVEDYSSYFIRIYILTALISLPLFIFFGLYNSQVRYMGYKAMLYIIYASSALSVIIYSIIYFEQLKQLLIIGTDINLELLSSGLKSTELIRFIIIFWLVLTFLIVGSRQVARWTINSIGIKSIEREFIIYGAGSAGRSAASALLTNKDVRILGYIDDNKSLHGMYVNNYPVLGGLRYIETMDARSKDLSVLLAVPSMDINKRREVLRIFEDNSISVRSLPPLNEIVVGITNAQKIESLRPEDLLDRDPVDLDLIRIQRSIKEKNILITGAGGSIGSELSRQIFKLSPKRIILLDHSELNLYNIHNELKDYLNQGGLKIDLIPKLGSILDEEFLERIFQNYDVDSIYHAAAYKHVSLVEQNIIQGTKNNVIGTYNLVTIAARNQIKSLIHISTDKAVRPTNFMGASKRLAELVIQGIVDKEDSNLKYTMVRFGNVLGSSGSVIPLFKKQIDDGGPVTVTHKDVTRFFMTISEASQLVIDAGTQAKGGEVFVLDMGEPVKINDLAKRMIRLSGYSVSENNNDNYAIPIKYVGLRPGEKIKEELILGKNLDPTNNIKVLKANEEFLNWDQVKKMIEILQNAISNNDTEQIKKLMLEHVTDYVPSNDYK